MPWPQLAGAVEDLKESTHVDRGGSDRGLRRALTKGLRRDLGRHHRGLLGVLRLLVKTLKGPLEKRLRQIEERLDRLDGK